MQKYCRKYKKIRASWTLYNTANSDGLDTDPETYELLRDIIEGRMKGKAKRGRKQLQMLSNVISKSYGELNREVETEAGGRKKHHTINLPCKAENRRREYNLY